MGEAGVLDHFTEFAALNEAPNGDFPRVLVAGLMGKFGAAGLKEGNPGRLMLDHRLARRLRKISSLCGDRGFLTVRQECRSTITEIENAAEHETPKKRLSLNVTAHRDPEL